MRDVPAWTFTRPMRGVRANRDWRHGHVSPSYDVHYHQGLLELADWLSTHGCTHVVMESTGVYWKPVWHVLEGQFA